MFALNHLVGFGAARLSGATVTHTDNVLSTSDLTTYSFAGRSIGTAAAGRLVVVAVHTGDTADNTLASGTIGGVAATVIGTSRANDGVVWACTGLMYAVVPTGTTATIEVTWSAATFRCYIGVFAVYDLTSTTPHDSNVTATGDPCDISGIDVPAGGVAIAAASVYDATNSSPTFAWTNLTERYDATGEGVNEGYSGACDNFAAAQSSMTITANPNPATRCSGVAASWR